MLFPTARRAPLQKSENYRYQLGFQCLALYTFVRWPPFHSLPASRRCLHASIPLLRWSTRRELLHFHFSLQCYLRKVDFDLCMLLRLRYARILWQIHFDPANKFFLIILLCFFSCYLIEAFAYFAGRCNKRYKYKINQCDACVTLYYNIRQISFIWMDRRIRMKWNGNHQIKFMRKSTIN